MLLSNYGNKEYRLPDKTSSIKEWGKVLSEISDTKAIMEEFSFWLDKAENYQNNFSPDIENGINSEDTINSYSISLEKDKTRQLLTEVNSKFNTKIDEILLTALLISYSKTIGKRSMLVHLEGHGRNQVSEEIDLSRTVGWFTTIYPVILELKKSISIEDSINVVKDQLREIPNQGFDYGLIRYLSSDEEIRKKLSVFDEQKITFNYLGQFDNILSADTNFKLADEKKGPERDLKNRRMSIIDVTGGIYEESLKMTFVFSKNLFRNETIEKFSQSFLKTLIDIIKQSMIQEKKTYAKSDFNLANLSDKKLDKIMSKLNKK